MAGHETTPPPTGGSGDEAGSGSAGKAAAPGDVAFEIPNIEVKGVLFEPQAIYAPAMMLVYPRGKTTIERQRAVYAKTKNVVQKQAQAAVLATLLYDKSKTDKDDAAKQKDWTDALSVLQDAGKAAGDGKADDITLKLIGRYALLLNDYADAEKAWAELVNRFPKAGKDNDPDENRAWWGYSLLMEYKNTDALDAVKNSPLSEKEPELAYVAGWAKFRAGDNAGAWQGIAIAAKGWGSRPGHDAIERDLYLFAGRTGTSLDDSIAGITPFVGKAAPQQVDLITTLGLESYQFAGRWADGIAAIDKALSTYGAQLDPAAVLKLRYSQANYALRIDDPAAVARFSKQALDQLGPCGAKCSAQDKENLLEAESGFARLMFALFATAHDDRYYQPAHDLYAALLANVGTNKQMESELLKDNTSLDSFKKMFTTKPGMGKHEKEEIGALLGLHNQEVQACYERGLTTNPKLAGTLVLHLESDQTGAIQGASTEPKDGMADLPLVASCVIAQARTWKLPKIANGAVPHHTRIQLTYAMSVRQHAADAAPTSAGTTPAKPAAKH